MKEVIQHVLYYNRNGHGDPEDLIQSYPILKMHKTGSGLRIIHIKMTEVLHILSSQNLFSRQNFCLTRTIPREPIIATYLELHGFESHFLILCRK